MQHYHIRIWGGKGGCINLLNMQVLGIGVGDQVEEIKCLGNSLNENTNFENGTFHTL